MASTKYNDSKSRHHHLCTNAAPKYEMLDSMDAQYLHSVTSNDSVSTSNGSTTSKEGLAIKATFETDENIVNIAPKRGQTGIIKVFADIIGDYSIMQTRGQSLKQNREKLGNGIAYGIEPLPNRLRRQRNASKFERKPKKNTQIKSDNNDSPNKSSFDTQRNNEQISNTNNYKIKREVDEKLQKRKGNDIVANDQPTPKKKRLTRKTPESEDDTKKTKFQKTKEPQGCGKVTVLTQSNNAACSHAPALPVNMDTCVESPEPFALIKRNYFGQQVSSISSASNVTFREGPNVSVGSIFLGHDNDEQSIQRGFADSLNKTGLQQFLTQNGDDNDYATHIANLMEYPDVVYVFPAYRCNDATKCKITVVVVQNTSVNSELINKLEDLKLKTNTDYVIKQISDIPQYDREMEVEVGNTGIDDTDKDIMLACFKKNAESLLSTHTNLSIVQGSFYKINRNLEETYEPRLVLYVIAKGYIPLGEDPFDKVYDGIQVDVREGMFTMFGNHADDALSNIRMGCKIQRVVNEQHYNGTLGVFFEHPEHGLCGITCAHAILTPEEHRNCIEYGLKKTWIDNHQQMVVYQPAKPHLLGHVVGIICSEGTMSNSGNDVAIIRIVDDRKPVNGKWPQPKSDAKELEFEYTSGRVFISKTYAGICYKFGGTTEYTEGRIANFGLNVTRDIRYRDKDRKFNNLIEVKQLKNQFANEGDSGSPVFVKDGDGDYVCLGIIIGGVFNVGPYYVIPIEKILHDIGITKLKSFSPSNAELGRSVNEIKTDVRGIMTEVAVINQKLDRLLSRLDS